MKTRILLVSIIAIVAAVALGNYMLIQRPLSSVIDSDPRNKGITIYAHYKYFVVLSSLIFDLRSVSGDNSPTDVSRVLFQFAQTQKEKTFTDVTLAYRGNNKFMLKGDFFRTVGNEYGSQNPIYTIRTFPENVYKIDGSPAFGTWTGGLIGVLGKQMEDFNDFHKQWYIADMARETGVRAK